MVILQGQLRMRIGFITDLSEDDFRVANQLGVAVLEYNENNDDIGRFIAQRPRLKDLCKRHHVSLGVIGRFGRNYVSDDPDIVREETTKTERLMAEAAELGASVFVTGAGHGEQRTHLVNCRRAVEVLARFVEVGKGLGLKVALYSSPWANFAFAPPSWNQILSEVPDLGLKYDPSHAYHDGRDWLAEMRDWGGRLYHVHARGCMATDGKALENPMPGLDQLNWGAFFGMLYHHRYRGDVMVESPSATWGGDRRHPGLRFSITYLRQFQV
jgi:sugar phosphate isomerase/epimerase